MTTKHWNTSDIPDLTGKTIIVTGGNSGLGFEAVKALATKNAQVTIACRNLQKGNEAKLQIAKLQPNAKISVMELDLASLFSINKFAKEFSEKHSKLDILINNAGIMMVPYSLTKDGFESQMGTNHLGHFALTGLLLDLLKKTPKSRVVNVSSIAHKNAKIDFENLLFENGKGYSPIKAYSRTKLSNLLFTYELQRYFEVNNIDCIALAAHPGVAVTNLANHMVKRNIFEFFTPLFSFAIQHADMGALPELRAATDPHAKGAEFYGPNGFREMKGFPVVVEPVNAAKNRDDAKKLWEISEKLTSVYF